MKFKTFRCIALLVVLVVVGKFGYYITHLPPSPGSGRAGLPTGAQPVVTHTPPAPTPIVQYTPPPQPIQVVQYTPPQPVYQPPVVVQYVPQVVVKPQVTVNELRAKLSAWLGVNTNRYRHGKQSADDILPSESFRADILRFKNEVNAAKFASNPGFWSQIRIDFTRDGTVDEQWLLREGLLYKREVIDTAGRVVGTPEWFK